MRARAPIVPVAVVGAEEAAPIFAQIARAAAPDRPPLLPDHADVPALRAARHAGLPARQVQDPLPRAGPAPTRWGDGPGTTAASCRTSPTRSARRIQEKLFDMLGQPPSGVVRMSRRILITGLSTYWGGRLAQALERDPAVETIIGVDRARPEVSSSSAPSSSASAPSTRSSAASSQAAEIDTVVDTRLVVDSIGGPPRDAHENNVIGTMNILAACGGPDSPVRKVVFKSSAHYYGCERTTRRSSPRTMPRPHPPRTPIERDIVEAERAVARLRRAQPATRPSRCCASPTAWARTCTTSHTRLLSLPGGADDPRLRPALPVHPRGRHRRRARARGRATTCTASTTRAADGVLALSEVDRPARQAAAPVLPPWGTGTRRRGRCAASALRIPAEMLQPAALRPRAGQPQAQGDRLPAALDDARDGPRSFAEHQRLRALMRRSASAAYRYEREVEEFLRWSPERPPANLRPPAERPTSRRARAADQVAPGSALARPSRVAAAREAQILPPLGDGDAPLALTSWRRRSRDLGIGRLPRVPSASAAGSLAAVAACLGRTWQGRSARTRSDGTQGADLHSVRRTILLLVIASPHSC